MFLERSGSAERFRRCEARLRLRDRKRNDCVVPLRPGALGCFRNVAGARSAFDDARRAYACACVSGIETTPSSLYASECWGCAWNLPSAVLVLLPVSQGNQGVVFKNYITRCETRISGVSRRPNRPKFTRSEPAGVRILSFFVRFGRRRVFKVIPRTSLTAF